jgi:hypothetical protein
MDIIAMSSSVADMFEIVPRVDVSIDKIAALNKINTRAFIQSHSSQNSLTFSKLPEKQPSLQCEPIDVLCQLVWPVRVGQFHAGI